MAVTQCREDGSFDWSVDSGSGEKWSDSVYIFKVQPSI